MRAGQSDNYARRRIARFDFHLKEGIGIDSGVASQNPTHAHGRDLIVIDKLGETINSILYKRR
ncbi:MAG: hypothetical protein DME50_17550 [Verrucomicrobia bacterium]|nr:MAG: hypothetical protein DME50_17550 [Verrucomicrobiota bacterium]